MSSLFSSVTIVGVVIFATFYQFIFKSIIFDTLGYGRVVQNISSFTNVRCQRIDDLGLESCEDMWLNDRTGLLYMSCSDSQSRVQWLPAMNHLNASGRGLTDQIVILDTRGTGSLASRIRRLAPHNFSGVQGDGTLNLHGLDIWEDSKQKLHILLINHRPPFDPTTGQPLDATKVGANSTIELFEAAADGSIMHHVRTYHDNAIQTPNDVAWIGEDAFVFTNDHSWKVGLRRGLDPFVGGGSIGYCSKEGCKIAKDTGLTHPNGIVRGHDGFIYTPSSINGEIKVLSLDEHQDLTEIGSFKMPMPVDNLSVDKHGHMLAAGFPQIYKLLRHSKGPFGYQAPSAIYVLQRQERKGLAATAGNEWHEGSIMVTKIMEDDGAVLSGFSIAVHDAETGQVFLGGPLTPFITICETR